MIASNFEVGSINAIKGNFEVIKKDATPNEDRQVEVLLFEDYEDEAFIQVQLISGNFVSLPEREICFVNFLRVVFQLIEIS